MDLCFEENCFTNEDFELEEDSYATLKEHKSSQKWHKRKLKENPINYTDEFDRTTYYTKKGAIWIGTRN